MSWDEHTYSKAFVNHDYTLHVNRRNLSQRVDCQDVAGVVFYRRCPNIARRNAISAVSLLSVFAKVAAQAHSRRRWRFLEKSYIIAMCRLRQEANQPLMEAIP